MNGLRGSPLSYGTRLFIAIAAEAIFIAGRTFIVDAFPAGIAQELVWSAWRLPFIALYLWLFIEVIHSPSKQRGVPRHPVLMVATGISLIAGPLGGFVTGVDLHYGAVLALTSPIVALREELFYRAILQNALEKSVGPLGAIVLAAAAFTAFHIGAQPMNVISVTDLAAIGILFGAIYQRTRNLWIVVALHTAYDVVSALSPSFNVIGPLAVLAANLLVMYLAVLWLLIDREAEQRKESTRRN